MSAGLYFPNRRQRRQNACLLSKMLSPDMVALISAGMGLVVNYVF